MINQKQLLHQLVDGRSGLRRSTLRSTSTGSSTGTPTPTHAPIPIGNPLCDPLLGHSTLDGFDPLTQFAREEMDPLSRMAADEVRSQPMFCSLFLLQIVLGRFFQTFTRY